MARPPMRLIGAELARMTVMMLNFQRFKDVSLMTV
jgi:hypothetical protein